MKSPFLLKQLENCSKFMIFWLTGQQPYQNLGTLEKDIKKVFFMTVRIYHLKFSNTYEAMGFGYIKLAESVGISAFGKWGFLYKKPKWEELMRKRERERK